MSKQAFAPLASPQNASSNTIGRHSANYRPSFWGDRFLVSASDDSTANDFTAQEQLEELKQVVRRSLVTTTNDKIFQKLSLIDAIQRLGVAYHFEKEIENELAKIYYDYNINDHKHLRIVALQFRLLRQQGFKVPCEVFNKFIDQKGNFKESLVTDVSSMLELYEASHMRVHGEDILEEALAFTTTHLIKSSTASLGDPLAAQVAQALKQPIRKGLPRLRARHFFSTYQEERSHNRDLLKFAKLDFNLLQYLHKKELSELSRWWKDLDFARKLPYARDRLVECYFWILGVYFEPQYSFARKLLTKVLIITSVIDDTYDAYATFEELEVFTEAIQRWDINYSDQLPNYMKLCYRALLDVYQEMEDEMSIQGKLYRVQYAKKRMNELAGAYFAEAQWLHEDYIPTMEEYMPVALMSTGYLMLITTAFVGMGDLVTKDAFDWVSIDTKMVKAALVICRFMDDIVSHGFEQQRGHAASSIQCYTKQHGATVLEACNVFKKQVVDAWKDINQAFLRPTDVPMSLLTCVLNFSRVIDLLYTEEDAYTHVGKAAIDGITSLLIDPVPI